VNRGLPVLDEARALDACRRSEGSWALVTRMSTFKGGGIRGTKTFNLSRNIFSLQVLVDVSRFSPCMINLLDPQQKHLLQVEEMQCSDWLICQSASKFVARQVVRLMKNEHQKPKFVAQSRPALFFSQQLSLIRNKCFCCATS